jgi:ArsR family transcriptional regulator
MKLVRIYQCLCDETRLRILHLLQQRALCVCHLQEILSRSQAQVSQHLTRLKKDGLVEAHRHQNWMIYSLPESVSPAFESHLKCLQDCIHSEPIFKKDLAALKKLRTECVWIDEIVPSPRQSGSIGVLPDAAIHRSR